MTELADVIWAVQMSTVEFHPWNSRRADVEKPDEWRIDLDPMPDCPLGHGAPGRPRRARGARRARRRRLAEDVGRQGHARLRAHRAVVRVPRRAVGGAGVRPGGRAARAPDASTTTWWRKDRDPTAVFVDYNQNARDHTMAAAYSVRGVPDGDRVDADHVGRDRRRRAGRLHDGDGPGALRRARRPARRHRRRRVRRSTSCSSGRRATSAPASPTLAPTRRVTSSQRAERSSTRRMTAVVRSGAD